MVVTVDKDWVLNVGKVTCITNSIMNHNTKRRRGEGTKLVPAKAGNWGYW